MAYKGRRFDGEDDARYVLELLNQQTNDAPTRAAQKRILKVVRALQELSRTRSRAMRETANRELQRYRNFYPTIAGVSETGRVEIDFAFRIPLGHPDSITHLRRMESFKGLVALGRKGLLGRLRQCKWKECQRWFFAKVNHQACCPKPARCYQKLYESSPEYKSKRNQRLRENYHRAKKRERDGLATVERDYTERQNGKRR